MTKVLIVGCGDLGAKTAACLQANGHHVIGVRRSAKQLEDITCIQADVTKIQTLNALQKIKPNILIYCVAANAQTDESYRLHYVDGLRNVLGTQVDNKQLQHVFFISSTRVYGQVANEVLSETTRPEPKDFGGLRLLEAEALLDKMACSTTVLRLSGIYGHNRLYLLKLVQDSTRWPIQDRWTNRIHRDDAANFLAFLCALVLDGKVIEKDYLVTDNMPVKLSKVLAWIAEVLNVPSPTFVERDVVNGKRLTNQRMRASGYQLQYADYQHGYREVLESMLESKVSKNG